MSSPAIIQAGPAIRPMACVKTTKTRILLMPIKPRIPARGSKRTSPSLPQKGTLNGTLKGRGVHGSLKRSTINDTKTSIYEVAAPKAYMLLSASYTFEERPDSHNSIRAIAEKAVRLFTGVRYLG